jgi:hypothetical protein
MPEFRPCLHEAAAVTMLQRLADGRIGAVTEAQELFRFDPLRCEVEGRLKISELRPSRLASVFSGDGRYFAFAHAASGGNAVRIVDIATNALVRSYATDENPVTLLRFDPTGSYLIAGTTTGRVFLWRTDGTNLIARLSSFPEYTPHLLTLPKQNYVSAAAFSEHLVATSGYGGSIVLTNIRTQANTRRIKPGKARIDAMLFLDERHLIAANEDGVIQLIATDGHHPIRRIGTGIGRIMHLVLLPDRHFLLAASAFNHIALINLETLEVVNNHYITTPSSIRSMALGNEHSVVAGMEDGTITVVELSPFREFKHLVDEGRYPEAYALGDSEPIIRESTDFQALDSLFREHYDRALRFLAEGRREDAHHLLLPFMRVPSKGETIRTLLTAFDHYPRFRHLVDEQRYAGAYGLSVQYPPLQETAPYKAMEAAWERAFLSAQKLVLRGREQEARRELEHFLTVTDKSPYIRLLLYNRGILVAFAKALGSLDYVALKTLTENEPILRQTPSYKGVMESAEHILEVIMEAIRTDAFEKAGLLCSDLLQIPHLAHHHQNISRFIEKAEQAAVLAEKGERLLLYELLDRSPELAVLPRAKKVEDAWNAMIRTCEEAALHGNAAAIKAALGELISLPTRSDKIGNLLRVSYQMQIKYLLSRKQPEAAGRAIERYIEIFGIDNETRRLLKLMHTMGEALILSETQKQNRPRALWLTVTQGELPDRLYGE